MSRFEQTVLGALMLDADTWPAVSEIVGVFDFGWPRHRLIFEAIADLASANRPIDMVSVADRLIETRKIDCAGGMTYLAELVDDTPGIANVERYAQIVARKREKHPMSEARTPDTWDEMGPEEQRAAALRERGLTEEKANELGKEYPVFPETEFYRCCRCERLLIDHDAGTIEAHKILLVATIPDDGAYVVCHGCFEREYAQ